MKCERKRKKIKTETELDVTGLLLLHSHISRFYCLLLSYDQHGCHRIVSYYLADVKGSRYRLLGASRQLTIVSELFNFTTFVTEIKFER